VQQSSSTPEDSLKAQRDALGPAGSFPALLDAFPFAALSLGVDGRILSCNEGFAAVAGRPRAEIPGLDLFDAFAAKDELARVSDLFERMLKEGAEVVNYEASVIDAKGARKTLVWSATPVRNAEARVVGVLAVGVDVSEHERRRESTLRDDKHESLGRLAAGAAHDFNNFLIVLSAQLEDLAAATKAASPAAKTVAAMRDTLARAIDLADQLMTYARRRPRALEPVDVAEVCAKSERILRASLRDGKTLDFDLRPTSPVVADFGQVQQVLLNLVLNAVDASPFGGAISVATAVRTLSAEQAAATSDGYAGRFAVLSVSDSGPGVPKEMATRVFEPFFTTKSGRGSGLGLAGAYALVRRFGGFFVVSNKEETGAVFEAFFPAPGGDAAE
jgi:two-component system, cell cycle sensor histidine kinase and response regulator CckA